MFYSKKPHPFSHRKKREIYLTIKNDLHNTVDALKNGSKKAIDMTGVNLTAHSHRYSLLPSRFGRGVKIKSLQEKQDEFSKFEKLYEAGGEMYEHFCNNCHEIIRVDQGRIIDQLESKTIGEGDIYFIKKGVRHHLYSPTGARLTVYQVYNDNYSPLLEELRQSV